ncbi:mas-related G-protein coupled receptor member H-like [Sylvia borin]
MEVTTMSPSPTSPTERDDLCEIDVTNLAIHSVTLPICLCGLVGNGAVLGLLSLTDHNEDIFDLAFADFLFLLFTVPSTLLFLVEDLSCSPIVSLLYLSFLLQLSVVSYCWALFQLTSFSIIVDMFKLCCRCNIPERLVWLVVSAQYWTFFALYIVIPAVTNLCPSHEQEHCRAALISMYALILLLFVAPVVISSTVNFIRAKKGSKKHQSKRRDIVMFLIVLFILLISLYNFVHQLGYTILSSQMFFLINCIHSSIKPFIYFLAGGLQRPCSLESLRSSLQRVFDKYKEETAHSNDAPMDTRV